MLIQLLFWGGILALMAWAITRIFPSQRGGEQPETREDSAEELLRQRFARGEIDAEEYEERRRILSGGA
jgi:putative membrane protein